MQENPTQKTSIGGTSAAPTIRKTTTHVGDTLGHSKGGTSKRAQPSETPSENHDPVAESPREQLNQRDRLRETRSSNPVMMVVLAMIVVAVGVTLYFTVLA